MNQEKKSFGVPYDFNRKYTVVPERTYTVTLTVKVAERIEEYDAAFVAAAVKSGINAYLPGFTVEVAKAKERA